MGDTGKTYTIDGNQGLHLIKARVSLENQFTANRFGLYLCIPAPAHKHPTGATLDVVTGATVTASPIAQAPPETPFVMDRQAAEDLMDTLWDAGIRPRQGAMIESERGALRAHLQDMRTLVEHGYQLKLGGAR